MLYMDTFLLAEVVTINTRGSADQKMIPYVTPDSTVLRLLDRIIFVTSVTLENMSTSPSNLSGPLVIEYTYTHPHLKVK